MASTVAVQREPSAPQNPIPGILKRLRAFGIPKEYIRQRVLPDWWDDSIADTPLGASQALMILSRNLALDMDSLANPLVPITPVRSAPVRFKTQEGAVAEAIEPTRCVAIALAQRLAKGAPEARSPMPQTATQARREILRRYPGGVTLPALLEYCWDIGIPVAHLPKRPPRGGKLDGLAVRLGGQASVVLTKNSPFAAWLVFVTAHDFGHIVEKHLDADGIVVDTGVLKNETDPIEQRANRFAVELLTGHPEVHFRYTGTRVPEHMAASVAAFGRKEHIDPGVVILNYAYHEFHQGRNRWPLANAVLKLLDGGRNAPSLVGDVMRSRLRWDALSDDACEFVERVTAL